MEDREYCSYCGGVLCLLGVLSRRVHLRCRNCGAPTSFVAPESEADDDDLVGINGDVCLAFDREDN